MFALNEVNYLGTVIAAAAAWMFGAAYYGLLGRAWIAALGKTMESLAIENAGKSAAAKASPFVLSFVGELLIAFVMYGILTHMGLFSLRAGMISGAFCWVGFVLPTVAINNAYCGRRVMLTLIDSVHWLGVLLIIGGVVGWMGPK